MPQWAGSCWYYLRHLAPADDEKPWPKESDRYWMPVDLYVGGAEHAVLHLLYARFWQKVLLDLGHVSTEEPFKKGPGPRGHDDDRKMKDHIWAVWRRHEPAAARH